MRLRALLWTLGIAAATTAAVVLTTVSWVPMVGVATAAVAVAVSKVASRLSKPVCWTCGTDLSGRPLGQHGIVCDACGSLHQPRPSSRYAADAKVWAADDENSEG